jgi:hypothetical protein
MNAQLNIVDLRIPQPNEAVVTDAQSALATVKSFHITDATTAVAMQQQRQAINTKIKELNAERVAMTKPIDDSKARIMAFFKRPIEFLEEALKHCDGEIVAHNRRLEDERREAQRKAELERQREQQRLAAIAEEARKKEEAAQRQRDLEARQRREAAEAEQRRIDEAAAAERREAVERQRKLDEEAAAARAAGNAEAARKAAEESARQKAESDARQRAAEAEQLRVREKAEAEQREADRKAEAERITAASKAEVFDIRASTTVAPVVATEAPKVAGVSMRDNWTYRIVDPTKINAPFMTPDTVKIGKLVKALRMEAAAQIGPGVEVFNEQVVASKRAGA